METATRTLYTEGQPYFTAVKAAQATLIANGGSNGGLGGVIEFYGTPSQAPRVEVFGNGILEDINGGATIGSLEGDGIVLLSYPLIIGSNNASTNFSGEIEDGVLSGSLDKIGTGRLVLESANSYTGGTTVDEGKLLAENKSGSASRHRFGASECRRARRSWHHRWTGDRRNRSRHRRVHRSRG